jgi:hypothetical protein
MLYLDGQIIDFPSNGKLVKPLLHEAVKLAQDFGAKLNRLLQSDPAISREGQLSRQIRCVGEKKQRTLRKPEVQIGNSGSFLNPAMLTPNCFRRRATEQSLRRRESQSRCVQNPVPGVLPSHVAFCGFLLNDDWAYGGAVKSFLDTGSVRLPDWNSSNFLGQMFLGALISVTTR